ncbi:DUF87 domain-containing protein [Leptospira sp. 85282-16]|uniref:ATP-binding protein n=1 Tax=Leptospira sp. 85282-16 TaxID=2971256 RepID=UPI0021C0F0AD|nr:DUF87 domain-containing protein [Leptospira sp. 85282-16]MCT8335777.1 DUF87 domain-containing protein [Leptospira sp. 85282-16]
MALLTLVDQPHFSKQANVFVNAVTGILALMTVPYDDRENLWLLLLFLTIYLLISSYILIVLYDPAFSVDNKTTKFLNKLNQHLGRPNFLFSLYFFYGLLYSFGYKSDKFAIFASHWLIFNILLIPTLSKRLNEIFERKISKEREGVLLSVTNPLTAIIEINSTIPLLDNGTIGYFKSKNKYLASFLVLDDRIIANRRLARCKIIKFIANETSLSDKNNYPIEIEITKKKSDEKPISVVDVGTNISNLSFLLNPDHLMEEGELVSLSNSDNSISYYQVVYADIVKEDQKNDNIIQYVKVISGQLGSWKSNNATFEPVKWVAKPGELIYRVNDENIDFTVPNSHYTIGQIPKSKFPINVDVEDLVTHNTAILGVTGSGKSFLAFNLIEAMISKGIKVLILDPSRQHYINLIDKKPAQIKNLEFLDSWLNKTDVPMIGIYQYAKTDNLPKTTSDFVKKAFDYYVDNSKLEAGKNEPAKFCIIMEEAHALIPEFNMVQKSDFDYVNETSKVFLQGRKFGMGGVFISQRTANITKTILNQCNTLFALQSFDQTSLDFFRNYMGNDYSRAISHLQTRHGILVGKASSSKKPVLFKINDYITKDETSI